ncbi:hypothetical protein [Thalassotalea ganghwensis]
MKKLLKTSIALTALVFAQQTTAAKPENIALFNELVSKNTYPIKLANKKASGEGLNWLIEQGAQAQYFLIGERHGLAEIPYISASIFEGLVQHGYSHAALEISPFGAYTMENQLKAGGYGQLNRYLSSEVGFNSIAFMGWVEEAEMAAAMYQSSANKTNFFIGPDQEFLLGFPAHLNFLSQFASTAEQKDIIKEYQQALKTSPYLFADLAPEKMKELTAHFRKINNSRVQHLLDDMETSNYIYGGFSKPIRIAKAKSNIVREELMKDNFLRDIRAERKRLNTDPKVFFKFGGYHAGANVDELLGRVTFGSFIQAYAKVVGGHKFNIFIECSGGGKLSSGQDSNDNSDEKTRCQSMYGELTNTDITNNTTHPFVNSIKDNDDIFVVDLRPIREHLEKFQFLDRDFRSLVVAFDAYMAIPNTHPATKFSDLVAAKE